MLPVQLPTEQDLLKLCICVHNIIIQWQYIQSQNNVCMLNRHLLLLKVEQLCL